MKTNKPLALFLILTFALASGPIAPQAHAAIAISAPSAVLLETGTNRIIYAKTPHLRRAPASTTKLLTSLVVLEHLDLNDVVVIPSFVTGIEPSKIHLRPGERYRVRELIRATLINSANDAAESLAFAAGGGSRAKFVSYMNAKTQELGCQNSNFVNASGLPAEGQYSTAYDMALIMREFEHNPFLVQTLKTRTLIIKSAAGRKIYLKNHNKMLWRDKREVIGKTGWTQAAKHCFVGQMGLADKKVVVAMLGSHRLWKDLKTLVDYEFGVVLIRAHQNEKIWATKGKVLRIQRALKRAGYYKGALDGRFGPSTIKAVRAFQRKHGIRADGVVGDSTWKKLQKYR